MLNNDFCLTSQEVAELFKCSVVRVNQIRKNGMLHGIKFGKRYLYSKKEADQLMRDATLIPICILEKMPTEKRKICLNMQKLIDGGFNNVNNN